MGNKASVSPNESDHAGKGTKTKPQQRPKERHRAKKADGTDSAQKAPRPRQSDNSDSTATKAAQLIARAPTETTKLPEVASNPQKTAAVPKMAAQSEELPQTATSGFAPDDDGSNLSRDRDNANLVQRGNSEENDLVQGQTKPTEKHQPEKQNPRRSREHTGTHGGSREDSASEENTSDSSGGDSYTSSSYTSRSDESDDDDASDDTFFIPEERKSLDGGDSDEGVGGENGGGVVVRVIVDGDREDADQAPVLDGSGREQEQKEKEKSDKRAGKSKRRRPANRHYIKDETMRTLFGLLPFYGGDGGPMDQIFKTTLASVGPGTIDVRNEAGDTLLILACQHACEDLVEPILAKGANPTAVNAVGICPLHFTCFADSLSFDAAEALLWRGADPSTAETTYGCTPLHYAASAGDADICALLMEHGAQPQTQDYYTYTAVKYAKDAGHETIVDLLGGEEGGEGWVEVEEVYMGTDEGEDGDDSGPSGGLWIRHIDPQTELAYYMNDETGESWWLTDLLSVAKDFLAAVSANGSSISSAEAPSVGIKLPPLAVREWLVQEQVRSWLVAIFSRADPLRLMEVDLVLQIGKADFKQMLKALILRYGIHEIDFLRKASSPKLEPLGISSLMPSKEDLGIAGHDTPASPIPTHSAGDIGDAQSLSSKAAEESRKNGENLELAPAATAGKGHNSNASAGGAAMLGQQEGRDNDTSSSSNNNNIATTNRTTLQRGASSQHVSYGLKRADSPAVLRADADKAFQEAVSQQEKELAEERKRQTNILDEQQTIIRSLEEMMQKRDIASAKTKKEAEEASAAVAKLQSALADDGSGQAASDSLSEDIARLKASIAAERVRFSHITEALEATKGSAEERAEKQRAQEEDRRVRLERLKSENAEEVEKLRTDTADSLRKTEEAWEAERVEMEQDLTKKVEQETAFLKETVENAARFLSEAAATTTRATDAARQGAGRVEAARTWMKEKAEAHANSRQIDLTNKQLHTSFRREMERAKQLHNQIEDMKGQTRMYARVRPMDALEKEAGCKEVCLRDGKQTLALLTAAQQHWTYTQVFQNPLADLAGTTAGQTELHKEVAGLGTTLADGHNILLLAAGASRSGKTFTLVGEPDETTRPTAESTASGSCLFFLAEVPSEDGGGTSGMAPVAAEARKVPKKGKGKGGGGGTGGGAESLHDGGGGGVAAKATPLAGIFPRLLAEAFATLNHRVAQCAFVVWVSAAAVSMSGPPDAASSRGTTVESLLPPSDPPPRAGGGGQVEDEAGAVPKGQKQKEERDPGLPPRAPPEDDGRWGGAVAASSPQEVMEIVTNARSRARLSEGAAGELRENRHFLFRVRVELVNRSSNEVSSCEMVVVELAEEKTGEAWPAGLAEAVRAHAAAASANSNKLDEATGLLGMVGACLTDTAKVVTLLCVSPADNHADKTERVLAFGKACENSGEDGAAQLRDLKKELARLKKETKGTKRTAPSQLPRPAGGKRA